nr:hypothetical protein GCM10020092_015270 [Actinoplanes digitatis]
MWRGLIEAYRDRLPVSEATPVVTLHEGNTPLVPAPVLSQRTGADVYLKVEGGGQPDRLLQGPWHDDGRVQGRRGGFQGDHLRLDR